MRAPASDAERLAGQRCARVLALPRYSVERAFAFLVESQIGLTSGPPTTTTHTTAARTTTAASKGVIDIAMDVDSAIVGTWQDFLELGTTFVIVIAVSVGLCLLCCCLALWCRASSDRNGGAASGERGANEPADAEFKSFMRVEPRMVSARTRPRPPRNPTPPDSSDTSSSVEFENVEVIDVVPPSHVATVTQQPSARSARRRTPRASKRSARSSSKSSSRSKRKKEPEYSLEDSDDSRRRSSSSSSSDLVMQQVQMKFN